MKLNDEQLDALTEVVNIGVGRAAASLQSLLERNIQLCVPRVKVCTMSELRQEIDSCDQPLDTSVVQGFEGSLNGRAMLAFPKVSGITLAKLLSEEQYEGDGLELDLAGILEELGNIVLNGVLGSLANVFGEDLHYSVPELCLGSATSSLTESNISPVGTEEQTCLLADARFDVCDSEISGSLLLAFNTSDLDVLLDQLLDSIPAA